jgi:hypothetical protein
MLVAERRAPELGQLDRVLAGERDVLDVQKGRA